MIDLSSTLSLYEASVRSLSSSRGDSRIAIAIANSCGVKGPGHDVDMGRRGKVKVCHLYHMMCSLMWMLLDNA